MGAKIREIGPGLAGTHLHYHDVEEEWAYVLSGRGRLKLGPLTLPVHSGHFAAYAHHIFLATLDVRFHNLQTQFPAH